ncbi:WecB/TagA/CpsF family glycosyltransferase [Thalassospira marina]|uniref:Glycosyltransferase n=1 Tax=Thalassospira marina TaxID=2048283 RepID=A0A2N3KVE5_9PROT|nr:WecB/TagA/CpsF family glycosyltransferase [Thalassospira marina]PKR54549.1 hypothetical protein COO20_07250 [Thalassospira marina]
MLINEKPTQSSDMNLHEINFLNMPMHNLEQKEVLEKVYNLSNEKNFSYVVTPNLDHITRNFDSNGIKNYKYADLSVCDSKVVSIIYKIIYKNKLHVTPGSDLTKSILEKENKEKKKNKPCITIIGCKHEQIIHLRQIFKNVQFNHLNPSYGFIKNQKEISQICSFIAENPSKFIFLCVGSPQQEILATELKLKNIKGTALCVGASINFITGIEKRAPLIFRKLALEWLFRTLENPKRMLPRYSKCAIELAKIAIKNIRNRQNWKKDDI